MIWCRSAFIAFFLFVAGESIGEASALHDAVKANDIQALTDFFEKQGNSKANETLPGNVTALHIAAALNRREAAVILLCHGAELEAKTTSGFTPLHWAAGRDAVGTVDLLISLGADVNSRNNVGITPLHWAASCNATNALRLLLLAGANLAAKTTRGLTPLHMAVRGNATEAEAMLAYYMTEEEPLPAEQDNASADMPELVDIDEETPPLDMSTLTAFLATNQSSLSAEQALPALDIPSEEKSGSPLSNAVLTPAPPPHAPARAKDLIIDLGRGYTLPFTWIEGRQMWIGTFEVTNGQFRRYRPQHHSRFCEGLSLDGNDQPAVYVSWEDASGYCDWLTRLHLEELPADYRFRLPTNKEWMFVARCGDNREYPWGSSWPPSYGNFSDLTAKKTFAAWRGIENYDDGFPVTCPVSESGANEWGIYGLAGNVWEWCLDWYDNSETYKTRQGGGWDFDSRQSLLINVRGFDRPEARYDTIGFRVAVAKDE